MNARLARYARRATTESAGQKTWDDSAAGHVALAKEYGLSCDVVVEAAVEEDDVCSMATYKNGNARAWTTSITRLAYREEAKKRGLTCGVETASAQLKSKSVCNLTNQSACDNEKTLCRLATNKGKWETRSAFKQYRKEAKKRGLTCGVGEAKAAKAKTPSSIALEASKQVCPRTGMKRNCTGAETNSDGDKWVGRWVNRRLYGVFTVFKLSDDKWKGDVRVGQYDYTRNEWSGHQLYVWRSGQARFDFDVPQSFQSNSTINKVFPELRRMFNALPKQQRRTIQQSMAQKDLYASTIDGAWGRNTLIGLSRFAAEHLNTINLKSTSNIRLVLDGLIAQASLTRTKMAPLNVLEEVAKKDAGFTRVASNRSSMKNAYIGEPALRRKQIQYALKKLGFYTSGVDGLWGNGTASALVSYQNEAGLQSSTPSQVFRGILSKVDVPSSFAPPKKKTVNKPASIDTGGLTSIISNPSMTGTQALAICRPQAELAKSQARSQANSMGGSGRRTYDLDCSFGSCRARDVTPSGGAWGGIAKGLSISKAGKRAYSAVLEACLAGYGWR